MTPWVYCLRRRKMQLKYKEKANYPRWLESHQLPIGALQHQAGATVSTFGHSDRTFDPDKTS